MSETETRQEVKKEDTYFAKLQRTVKEAVGSGPISVYYPGIGGGEEPIDSVGPFADIDADEVYGVDIFDIPFDRQNLGAKLAQAENRLQQYANSINAQSFKVTQDNKIWLAEFNVGGKRKTLEIPKNSIDATLTAPPKSYPVVYTRRTYTLIKDLPTEVLRNTRVIFDIEQYQAEARIIGDLGSKLGFTNIDLTKSPNAKKMLGTEYSPSLLRLLVRK